MKSLMSKVLLICVVMFSSAYAFASLEILANYSMEAVNPGDLNTLNHGNISPTFPIATSNNAFGADARYVFPVVSLLVGARYEAWSAKQSGLGIDQTITSNRTALLVGYRIWDTGVYLGVLGSYGLSHQMKVATSGFGDVTPASSSSYSVSAEAGIHVSHFMVGAELGYLSMVGSDMQSNGTSLTINGNKSNLDLSGVYGKIVAGFSFL